MAIKVSKQNGIGSEGEVCQIETLDPLISRTRSNWWYIYIVQHTGSEFWTGALFSTTILSSDLVILLGKVAL